MNEIVQKTFNIKIFEDIDKKNRLRSLFKGIQLETVFKDYFIYQYL